MTVTCTDVDGGTLTTRSSCGQRDPGPDAGGSRTYTPDPNYNGTDSFTFKANDGPVRQRSSDHRHRRQRRAGLEDVSITTAEDTAGSTDPDCSDVDGDTLTYAIVAQPADGMRRHPGPAHVHPERNFNGSDSFTYKANDGTADSNAANVAGSPSTPSTTRRSRTTTRSRPTRTPLGSTRAGAAQRHRRRRRHADVASLVATPSDGTLTLQRGRPLRLQPEPQLQRQRLFTYKANDGTADSYAPPSITVNAVNDAPACEDGSISTDEDTARHSRLPVCSDVEGDTLTYAIVAGRHGSCPRTRPAQLDYTPNSTSTAATPSPTRPTTAPPTGTPPPSRSPSTPSTTRPSARTISITTDEDTAGPPSRTASDVDGDTLTYSIVAQPATAAAAVNLAGQLEYSPTRTSTAATPSPTRPTTAPSTPTSPTSRSPSTPSTTPRSSSLTGS